MAWTALVLLGQLVSWTGMEVRGGVPRGPAGPGMTANASTDQNQNIDGDESGDARGSEFRNGRGSRDSGPLPPPLLSFWDDVNALIHQPWGVSFQLCIIFFHSRLSYVFFYNFPFTLDTVEISNTFTPSSGYPVVLLVCNETRDQNHRVSAWEQGWGSG